jgi:Ca2+-binding EF-hand superfamily protein
MDRVKGAGGFDPSTIFSSIDTSANGYITKDQLTADMKKHGITDQSKIDEMYKAMDADSDGKITKSEFTTGMKKNAPPKPADDLKSMISEMGNSISASDLKSLFDMLKSGKSSGQSGTSDSSSDNQWASDKFDSIDTAGNGYITKDQLAADMKSNGIRDQSQIDSMFTAMDGDSDGKITKSEFTKGLQKNRPAGPHPPPPPQGGSGTTSTDSSSDSTSSTSSEEQQYKLQLLMDMMKQVLSSNNGNGNSLKGMFVDSAR